jgi:DNA mismatch repair protein MutS
MTLSPMMQQYHEAKQATGDALLFFRMGDFYELFHDDARRAAKLLGLTLTSRDKGENPVPMAGFPHHQLEGYLAKIIRLGHRAAICEQVEDPKQAKGLVRREVTRIVSRGTVTDDGLLNPQESNYLAAIAAPYELTGHVGVAWVDVSTGRFQAAALPQAQLADELARLDAAECLVSVDAGQVLPPELAERVVVTQRPDWAFGRSTALAALTRQFGAHALEGFGFTPDDPRDATALCAAGAILDYLVETQKASLAHIERLLPFSTSAALQIDGATWRSLEITHTLRDGRRDGALLGVMDRTVTAMGARTLAEWLRYPLTNDTSINARLDAVGELVAEANLSSAMRELLGDVYDLERLLARVTTGRATPRDLQHIARTLAALPKLKAKLAGRTSALLSQLEAQLDLCPELRAMLESALDETCPLIARDGGFVRPGYSAAIDECRELMVGGKQWMARYQAEQIEATGITSLKVGFNNVFGYYLEVTHAHRERVPAHFIRKQTLKNAERYITPELKEYEEKVLTAEERGRSLEYDIFLQLRDSAAATAPRLLATASALAQLDVLGGLANLARSRNYCRPMIVAEPKLTIEQGRHPVLDSLLPEGSFVPNDVRVAAPPTFPLVGVGGSCENSEADSNDDPNMSPRRQSVEGENTPSLLLITGPNMAGKSTFIRQNALLTLMAQVGSFLPAKSATIGVADRLFARVGASDELSRGQSTFMVEMTETARILNTATARSVVVLDEIGRGTSTYDGLSLAWAIVEHLHDEIGCRTLFATHYHELTELAGRCAGVANLNVAVREHRGQVVFLHQIVPGAADKSYGIHVAQLAGVPRSVNDRAAVILSELEQQQHGAAPAIVSLPSQRRGLQLMLFETAEHPLLDELRKLDLNNLTPLAALAKLQAWKEEIH